MKRKTRRQKKLVNTLLALTLAAGLAPPAQADAATYTATSWIDFRDNIVPKLQSGDTVTFASGAYIMTDGADINIPLGATVININGNGAVVDAGGNSRMLFISGNFGSISNIAMVNGNADTGGAVHVTFTLTGGITNSVFANNTANTYGGAVSTNSLTGGIINSTFTNNTANSSGGAVRVGGDFTGGIINSVFTNNTATTFTGGAVYVGGDTTGGITNSVFTNNTAGTNGGAVYANFLTGGITNSVFTNNTAFGYGGVVYARNLTGGITNSVFTNNTAINDDGGAVCVDGSLTGGITGSVFANNTAGNDGGAVFVQQTITGGITNSVFTNNRAGNDGGAVFARNLTGGITNSVFTNNTAGNDGGAICISSGGATIDNNAGQSTLFHGNTANSTPNSIYFGLANNNGALDITGTGPLLMYDPIATRNANTLTVNKTGDGVWVLGGSNAVNANTLWNITGGTLLLTDDSPMAANANITGANFTLASGATLLVAPNTTTATIGTAATTLGGTVGIGTDERYRAYIDPSAFNSTLLTVANMTTNNSTVLSTSGIFGLGQYDYTYDGLAWNGSNLTYRVTSAALSPERNGIYAANAPLYSALANGTTPSVFVHLDDIFSILRPNPLSGKVRYIAAPKEEAKSKKQLDVWGTLLNNNSRTDTRGLNAGSSVNTPGLIIGTDKQTGERSFIGGAISATWPDYEQGRLDADGKDIRLALYGGNLLTNGWQLGYTVSAGKGNITHRRRTTGDTSRAKYDIASYALGLSVAKPIEHQIGRTIKPYLSYEYIKSLSDGYTESSHTGLADITAGGQNNTISRVKLGMNHRKENARGTFLEAGLYWQGLFGDKEASVTSFMNTNPGAPVSLTGTGMDSSALGIDLSWGRKVGKTDMALSYNGVYGAHSRSNTFSVNFTYKF